VALLVGTAALVLTVIAMPESPRWLLLNGKKEQAIKNLNYIAWFNGTKHRIPETAQFVEDLNEQNVVVENLEKRRLEGDTTFAMETSAVNHNIPIKKVSD